MPLMPSSERWGSLMPEPDARWVQVTTNNSQSETTVGELRELIISAAFESFSGDIALHNFYNTAAAILRAMGVQDAE